jgi:hypothetical protein
MFNLHFILEYLEILDNLVYLEIKLIKQLKTNN